MTTEEVEPTQIRLMNEYSVDMPLWVTYGQTDGEDLNLTDALRSDLYAFAARWDAAVPDEVFDDRFDHLPLLHGLVGAGRSVRRMMRPAARREAVAEGAAIRDQGEALRGRLQSELGERYLVIYVH